MKPSLQYGATGVCVDHPCDACSMCRGGKCCRRDKPNYTLPSAGDWDGPNYGTLGVFEDDGGKALCHICGEWLTTLGMHIVKKHGIWAEEYRAYFGLKKGQRLCSEAFGDKMRSANLRRDAVKGFGDNLGYKFITAEMRSGWTAGRKLTLQQRNELDKRVGPFKHGTRNGYGNRGCRCEACCRANTLAVRAYIATHPEQQAAKRDYMRAKRKKEASNQH